LEEAREILVVQGEMVELVLYLELVDHLLLDNKENLMEVEAVEV
jgi:hypothetical protein